MRIIKMIKKLLNLIYVVSHYLNSKLMIQGAQNVFLSSQFYHSSHFAIKGAVKNLRSQRAKPDQSLYLSLLYLVKTPPYSDYFSNSEYVLEAFCSLLKRDVKESYKSKGTF